MKSKLKRQAINPRYCNSANIEIVYLYVGLYAFIKISTHSQLRKKQLYNAILK